MLEFRNNPTYMNHRASPLSAKWFARSAADELPAGGHGGAKTAALVTMGRYFLILLIASLFPLPSSFPAALLSLSRSLSSLAQFLFATLPAARKFLILRTAHLSLATTTSMLRGTLQLQYTSFSASLPHEGPLLVLLMQGLQTFWLSRKRAAPPLEGIEVNDIVLYNGHLKSTFQSEQTFHNTIY